MPHTDLPVSDLPVLYSFRRCPYAMRARLALAASRQTCQLREVVLRNKPQALLDASPKATVPVLVLADGTVIDESLDIMLWALRRHDPSGWLPHDATQHDALMHLIQASDGPFKANLDRYKYPNRYQLDSGLPHRDDAAAWLHTLNQRLAQHPYLCGTQATLADYAIAPFVRQYAHTDINWFRHQDWPALLNWLDAFLASDLFAQVMYKYAPWEPGQPPVVFTDTAD